LGEGSPKDRKGAALNIDFCKWLYRLSFSGRENWEFGMSLLDKKERPGNDRPLFFIKEKNDYFTSVIFMVLE
jgi:hypothetical protein